MQQKHAADKFAPFYSPLVARTAVSGFCSICCVEDRGELDVGSCIQSPAIWGLKTDAGDGFASLIVAAFALNSCTGKIRLSINNCGDGDTNTNAHYKAGICSKPV